MGIMKKYMREQARLERRKTTPLFILSTGRSGSMTIANTLSAIGDYRCVHEPSPELIIESSGYRYGRFKADHLRTILKQTRPVGPGGGFYCESNQNLALIIPVLVDTFPEGRYLWLIRNGLDQVASAYAKQWYSGHSENHDRYEDCPPIERAWIDGRIQGDLCGDMSAKEWNQLDRFGRCCWYWTYVNELIQMDLRTYASNRYVKIRLEELNSKLAGLVDWMGLHATILPTTKRTNVGKRKPYPWTTWNRAHRQTFEYICGNLMDRLYPAWRTHTGIWTGVPYEQTGGVVMWLRKQHHLVKIANEFFTRGELR